MISKDLKYFFVTLVFLCIIGFSVTIYTTNQNILTYGSPIFMIFYGISGYSPALAAIITIKIFSSNYSFINFIKNITNIRKSFKEYFYVLIVTLILWTIPFIVVEFHRGKSILLNEPLISLVWITPIMIFGGGLEEIGWRGYLLPKLLKKYSDFTSSLIVGSIWSLWHLPLWFVVGTPQQGTNFLPFALTCIASSFILTYIYTETNSIWLCILFHALDNACSYVFKYDVGMHIVVSIATCAAGFFIFYFSKKYIRLKSI